MNRGHYATALRAFRNLAEAPGRNNIGYLYERGLGVPQDYGTALKWYKSAASKFLPEGEYNTGLLYHHGYGVAKNSRKPKNGLKIGKKILDAEFMGPLYQNGWGKS